MSRSSLTLGIFARRQSPLISVSISNLFKIFATSSIVKSTPIRSTNFWCLSLISFSSLEKFPTSLDPSTTSAIPISDASWQTLSTAVLARLGSSPFSNLEEASLLRLSLLEVFLIFSLLKFAPSNKTLTVLSVISESSPPIIPARPMISWPSVIKISSDSNFLVSPSRVTVSSPSFAILTTIFFE